MKQLFCGRLVCGILGLLMVVSRSSAAGVARNWTNSLGGNWFDPSGWSPNGVPANGDAVTITNIGTYSVFVVTGAVAAADITVGGANGQQTFLYGSTAAFSSLLLSNSFVKANGVLLVTNLGVTGTLTVQAGGELRLNSSSLQLYNLALTNQGTVTWSNGSLSIGGSNNQTTYITNSGLFQILADFNLNYGGGSRPTFYNTGIVRKLSGTGTTGFGGIDLINFPSGNVDVLSGTLQISPFQTNYICGSYTATAPSVIKFGGNETDAGGTTTGTGQFLFNSGTFYLRTNTIANIQLLSGDVYVTGTTTFQQGGAITNLTLDGANLRGTNRIAGTVIVNAGNLADSDTILPGGHLLLASANGTLLYSCLLINQGTVNWSGKSLSVGGTPPTVISNGGTWTMTGDAALNFGGGITAYFTNAGTIQKTGGIASSDLSGVTLINLPSGLISATTGILKLPFNYTNAAGEMRLNGGTLSAGGTLGMTGGTLDGAGTVLVAAAFDGGTVSPGAGPGLMAFSSSLSLGSNATLSLDGTGTVPGVTYDQLSVTGAVAISNCTLQVTLPNVPVGTTFVIITNTTGSSTTGSFNDLAENAPLIISGQPFRIHYAGGNGNDVVLVRDSGTDAGPQLNGGYTNKTFKVRGVGNGSTIFTIQASTNFLQWTNVGLATGDVSGNFIFTDTNAINYIYRFYRTTN